jgi:hypothetical protein
MLSSVMQNEPNPLESNVQNEPNFRPAEPSGTPNCAKQTQFPPRRQEGQRLGGKGVMVNSTCDRPRQNKANLGKPGWGSAESIMQNKANSGGVANRAKQTQFLASRALGNTQLCKTKPICPAARVSDTANRAKRTQFLRSAMAPEDEMCKTKPICWSQMRKTKPISGEPGPRQRSIVQNEAKLGRAGVSGGRRVAGPSHLN